MQISTRILISRFLTFSGDQAWDFAVPLVLLTLLPGQLKLAALYFLAVHLLYVLLFPRVSSLIDKMNRPRILKIGLALQAGGVLIGLICVLNLQHALYPALAGLILGGILENLGSGLMNVFIANDLIPSVFGANELTRVNSRLRQMDLITEITIPIVAGFVLLTTTAALPLLGLILIALWNILSFVPEYLLLSSVFTLKPELRSKHIHFAPAEQVPFFRRLTQGWRDFWKEPIALSMLTYTLICLGVMSPHGALITGFLKDAWQMPETTIGVFRGSGAAFGMIATFAFGWVSVRLGLVKSTQAFVCFQALMIATAGLCFWLGGSFGQIGFLVFIVLSRPGLYGFCLGEVEIRQVGIHERVRGRVNGFAGAMAQVSQLVTYLAATLFLSIENFQYFVLFSVMAIASAALVFSYWAARSNYSVRAE